MSCLLEHFAYLICHFLSFCLICTFISYARLFLFLMWCCHHTTLLSFWPDCVAGLIYRHWKAPVARFQSLTLAILYLGSMCQCPLKALRAHWLRGSAPWDTCVGFGCGSSLVRSLSVMITHTMVSVSLLFKTALLTGLCVHLPVCRGRAAWFVTGGTSI